MAVVTRSSRVIDPWGGDTFTVTKGALLELIPQTAEGGVGMTYEAECTACQESCRMDNDARPVQAWAIDHTRNHPTHRQYVLTMRKNGRVTPIHRDSATRLCETPDTAPTTADRQPTGPRSHARPRPPRRRPALLTRRTLATIGRFAGVLFIVTMSSASGLVAGLALATGTR